MTRLADLLAEIDRASGPVTVPDLARRLGIDPGRVEGMLAALRAAGRLRPDGVLPPGTEACASSGSCGRSCPGPAECPFVISFGDALEVRRR